MASYAMAHLKMDMLLTETGYKPTDDQRFKIFLTNSLEEHHKDTGTIFSHWLADEANQANAIKRDAPVMVVIGNPPYSVSSTNKSKWIESLTADYKKDLNERNIQPLSDDYIKFIRFGQHFIDKNGEGILAYISNNSFIDGIIHRQMRKHLAESFDKIYILDLHGNAKKKETAPDGSPDQNVFDIMQGVSINIFVKTDKKQKNDLAEINHFDLYGKRKYKYNYLNKNNIQNIDWKIPTPSKEYYYVKKNHIGIKKYEKGFSTKELFKKNNCGIVTARDHITIQYSKIDVENVIHDLQNLDEKNFREKYNENKDSRDWTYLGAKNDTYNKGKYIHLQYRPFDIRYSFYTKKSKGFMSYPRYDIMSNLLYENNLGIILPRQLQGNFTHSFITNSICDGNITSSARLFGAGYVFPLYLYPNNKGQLTTDGEAQRVPNLDAKIVKQIAKGLGLKFVPEKEDTTSLQKDMTKQPTTFAPIDLLDYIYAMLHAPSYREKYKEFLKIDFPRVPYPTDKTIFWKLVQLGGELRQIHLLESPVTEKYITQYPIDGDNIVGKPYYEAGNVYINYDKKADKEELQHFSGVPETAWNFYIGGYQPAQKWLKDRKGRELNYEDIFHYQKIIVALSETDRLMKEINTVLIPE